MVAQKVVSGSNQGVKDVVLPESTHVGPVDINGLLRLSGPRDEHEVIVGGLVGWIELDHAAKKGK